MARPPTTSTPGGGGGTGRRVSGGGIESEARSRARDLRWERVRHLERRDAVVTGAGAPGEPAALPDRTIEGRRADPLRARLLLVFVHADPATCDGSCEGACQRYFDADENVFGGDKMRIALRAFRPVWMTPEDAANELLLGDGAAGELPRLVVVDVARETRTVLDGRQLDERHVYTALTRAAKTFYEENLDRQVKRAMKILDEQDQLAEKRYQLQEQLSLCTDDRRIQRLRADLDELDEQRRDLDRDLQALFELTLKDL